MSTPGLEDRMVRRFSEIVRRTRPLNVQTLAKSDLPAYLRYTIRTVIEDLFTRARPLRIMQPERLDLRDPEIRRLLGALRPALIDRYCVRYEEIQAAFEREAALYVSLYFRPFYSLSRLHLWRKSRLTVEELDALFRLLPPELPVLRTVREWLQEQEQKEISREYFHEALRQIRSQMYEEGFLSPLLEDLRLFLQFCAKFDGEEPQSVSRDLLVEALNDRGAEQAAAALLKEERRFWTLQEFTNFIERYHLVGDLQAEASSSRAQLVEEVAGDLILTEDGLLQRQEKSGVVDFDLDWKLEPDGVADNEFSITQGMERELTMADFSMTDEERKAEGTEGPEDSGAEEFKQQTSEQKAGGEFEEKKKRQQAAAGKKEIDPDNPVIDRQKIEKQPPGPYPSLYTFMDEKIRKTFIKKLFGNDEEAFADFVDRVDRANSWKEAKAIFDAELSRRQINVYSKNAIKLSDFLFSRYFSRNRY